MMTAVSGKDDSLFFLQSYGKRRGITHTYFIVPRSSLKWVRKGKCATLFLLKWWVVRMRELIVRHSNAKNFDVSPLFLFFIFIGKQSTYGIHTHFSLDNKTVVHHPSFKHASEPQQLLQKQATTMTIPHIERRGATQKFFWRWWWWEAAATAPTTSCLLAGGLEWVPLRYWFFPVAGGGDAARRKREEALSYFMAATAAAIK